MWSGIVDCVLRCERLQALDRIVYKDINIERSKVTFVCGESGCGKSTLLKLFNASVSPTGGSVFYNNENIEGLDTIRLRQNVLLCGQKVFLFDETIGENFATFHGYRGTQCPTSEEMHRFLGICCGDFSLDKRCQDMSGGERQRVFLAISLSFMPKVLLLDEPTAALDKETGEAFFNNLIAFAKEKAITLVVISHQPSFVEKFADSIITLKRGDK